MKKLIFPLLTVLLIGCYSCSEQPSKAVQALEKDIEALEAQIQETAECDDLQLLTFSILGLRTDLEKIQQDETVKEAEVVRLTDAIDQLDASLNGKYVALDCNQNIDEGEIETFGEDEYEDYNIL